MDNIIPVGKLPSDLLARLLAGAPVHDKRVLLGPGIGLDCAVIDMGDRLLVWKSDPITFATDEIGWYAVQVNSNDIATTGALPRWMLVTLLLPEGKTTPALVEEIFGQVFRACENAGIALVGGHSEITYGLDRPILVATLTGEVQREQLVTPQGCRPGDRVLLTKGVPIEGTAVLARQFPERLSGVLSQQELSQAQQYLYSPGISVLKDARIALQAGRVTSMHDPTEGGLATALWELAEAAGVSIRFEPGAVPVPPLAERVCRAFGLDPLGTIASGALLLTVSPESASSVLRALENEGIACAEIGGVEAGEPQVQVEKNGRVESLPRPVRDEIARLYEAS